MNMKVFKRLSGLDTDWQLNRNEGMASFYLFRFSGLLLTVFVLWHIPAFLALPDGAEAVRAALPNFGGLLGWLLAVVLVAALVFHTLHGMRLILVELLGLEQNQRALTWSTFALFGVVMLICVLGRW